MLEIIVFIIIIMAVVQSSKKKNTRRQAPPFTARPQRLSGSFSSRPAQPSKPLVSGARQKKQKKNASGRKAEGASPVQASGGQSAETRTFIEPTRPYQPARNAGERYEEWMSVPEGKRVCHCGYCGADNLIPKHSDPKNYTCYFCREEL